MKKLVLALLASSFTVAVFATSITETPTQQTTTTTAMPASETMQKHQQPQHKKLTHPPFTRHDIVCGDKILGQKENADGLSDKCKNYKFKDDKATFIDEHSSEHVMCHIKNGELIRSTCNPIKKK